MIMSMAPSPVTVFWRPGCPYCVRLRSRLRRAGVDLGEVNIWDDPAGAAFVRSVTGGDETVPTVRIGDHSLVNPSAGRVIAEIRELDPSLIADTSERALIVEPLRAAQWIVISLLIVLSLISDALGHSGLSWGIDAVAVLVYLVFRSLRMRMMDRRLARMPK